MNQQCHYPWSAGGPKWELLNLGRTFSLPREHWPVLCSRIEQILSGQMSSVPISTAIEALAQRYAARLVAGSKTASAPKDTASPVYHEVDVYSLELVRPRSIGVEHVGLEALGWL